jgi:hypothetical protein
MPTIAPSTSMWGNIIVALGGALVNLGVTPVAVPQGGNGPLWVAVVGLLANAVTHAISSAQAGPLAAAPAPEKKS